VVDCADKWYWLKRAVFAVMFWSRARKQKKPPQPGRRARRHDDKKELGDRGLGQSMDPSDMECIQPLLPHKNASVGKIH
jgi:hypothetical protein